MLKVLAIIEIPEDKLPTQSFSWTSFHVDARICEIQAKIQRYKELLSRVERSDDKNKEAIDEMHELQREIGHLLAIFREDDPSFIKFVERRRKTERHKRWKKKKRSKIAEMKREEQKLGEIMDKLIDEWMNSRIAEHRKQVFVLF